MRRMLILIVVAALAMEAGAFSQYAMPSNGFGALVAGDGITISTTDKELVVDNATGSDWVVQDTTRLPHDYRYSVLLANVNNKRGRKATRWGVAIDIAPNGARLTVELERAGNNTWDDISNEQGLAVSLVKHTGERREAVARVVMKQGAEMDDGFNVLTVDASGDNVRVLVGRKQPETVLEQRVERNVQQPHVGVLAGTGARVKVKRTLLNYEPDRRIIKPTQWNEQSLAQHLAASDDPAEGMWQYLDRDMEEKIARMGGRYRLATVANEEGGYDIIYIDGAQVNDKQWKPYMLKGKLTPTIFMGNYDAMWIDSNFEPIRDDVQAVIEEGVILAIKLPVLKSQLRFSKVIGE